LFATAAWTPTTFGTTASASKTAAMATVQVLTWRGMVCGESLAAGVVSTRRVHHERARRITGDGTTKGKLRDGRMQPAGDITPTLAVAGRPVRPEALTLRPVGPA